MFDLVKMAMILTTRVHLIKRIGIKINAVEYEVVRVFIIKQTAGLTHSERHMEPAANIHSAFITLVLKMDAAGHRFIAKLCVINVSQSNCPIISNTKFPF